jgi:hypothetical protein
MLGDMNKVAFVTYNSKLAFVLLSAEKYQTPVTDVSALCLSCGFHVIQEKAMRNQSNRINMEIVANLVYKGGIF